MRSQYYRLLSPVVASFLLITASLAAGPAGELAKGPIDNESPSHALAYEPCSEADLPCSVATEASRLDLATYLDIEPDQIEILRKDRVTWNSGSLGCPKPGMMYTQAVINGLFIEFRVCETSYYYHAGHESKPFLCVQPQPANHESQLAGTPGAEEARP